MQLTEIINENVLIEKLAGSFTRSALQLNGLQESDAELIRLPGTELILAVSTDTICEELETGLYDDPYMIGWMTVIANLSDLAAVGAEPLGILINETLTADLTDDFISQLQKGISDACGFHHTHVLGGDTNYSERMMMSATAAGLISNGKPVIRKGCSAGDIIYSSGMMGSGNAYAFSRLTDNSAAPYFRPSAKLKEGRLLSEFASCCMDTSDSFFAALDQLMRINKKGFRIERPVEEFIPEEAKVLCDLNKIPYWFMLAGIHGEYELLFTVPAGLKAEFLKRAALIDWYPAKLGEVTLSETVECRLESSIRKVDTGEIRNLFGTQGKEIGYYLSGLMKIHNSL